MDSPQTSPTSINYDYWLKSSNAYSSLILPSIDITSQASQLFSIIHSLSYQTRYTLILEVFFQDLSNINQKNTDNLLQNLYNFASPVLHDNPQLDLIILVPQLTTTQPLLLRDHKQDLDTIFEHDLFSLQTSSFHKEVKTTIPVQSLTQIPHSFSLNNYYSPLQQDPEPAKPLKAYNRSCLGGTYDHLHPGHKLFLSFSALVTKEYLLIGLTSDELLTKKSHKAAIQSFETRFNGVARFIDLFDPKIFLDLVEIHDPAGPAKDGDFDVIVVTPETVKGGAYVNNLRKEGGFKELEVVVGGLISPSGEIHDKLSSTNIRERIVKKLDGKEDVLEKLYVEWTELMESLEVKESRFVGVWFDRLKEKYSESWRYYHTLAHVWSLLSACNENKEKIKEMDVVKLTAWFHDVIYVPQKHDNEKESARLFERFVRELDERTGGKHLLTEEKQKKVEKIILYTINHTKTEQEAEDWFDAKFFLDIDLGILGADENVYLEYAENIKKEYSFVPEKVFREKRAQFMRKFLNKELQIYKTELFKERLEERALKNIQAEVNLLEAGI